MDDQVLSSLCRDSTSYFTFAEQKAAIQNHKSPQRRVSPNGNTYILMVIGVSGHWVAVQVTISPFTLEEFRGQTFFSSQLRYGPCCRQINNTDTSNLVVDTVQRVVDSKYRPVCWDYSQSQWYVDISSSEKLDLTRDSWTLDHPTNTDVEGCVPVTKSRFQTYADSAHAGSTGLARDYTSTVAPANPINAEGHLSQSRHLSIDTCTTSDNTRDLACRTLPARQKRKLQQIAEPSEAELPAKKQRTPTEAEDAKLLESTISWLKNDLKNLSENFPSLALDIVPPVPRDEGRTYAEYLWSCADELEGASQTTIWSLRFIAACCSLVGAAFASPAASVSSSLVMNSKSFSRQTLQSWRCFAELINAIIDGMLPRWKGKAYIIYHLFAAKGQFLSRATRISNVRRKRFATSVVTALQDLPLQDLPALEGVSFFSPVKILTTRLASLRRSDKEICSAIGLPSAITYPVIESESPWEPIPEMAQLCCRLNRDHLALMAPPARLDSGGDRNLDVTLVVRAGHADRQASSSEGGEPCMNNGIHQQGRTQPDLASQAGKIDTERHHVISDQGKVNARTDGTEADASHGHESPQLPGLTPEEEPQLYEEGFDPLEVRPSMYSEGFEKLFLCDS